MQPLIHSVLVLLILCTLTGCGPATTATVNGDPADNADGVTGGGDVPDGGDADSPGKGDANGDGGSSSDQADEPTAAALVASRAIVVAVVAALPVEDATRVVQGLAPAPSCPVMEATPAFDAVEVTFDYEDGCALTQYPTLPVAGQVDGALFFINAFDLTLTEVSAAGETIDGSLSGSVLPSSTGSTLVMRVELTRTDGASVDGNVTAEIDDGSGVVTITDASVTLYGIADAAYEIELANALVDPAVSPTLQPHDGTATVTKLTDQPDEEASSVDIEFTEATSTDGTVSLGGGQ